MIAASAFFMSHATNSVYAASCNLPRRAKRPRNDISPAAAVSPTQPRPLLPALSLRPSSSNTSSASPTLPSTSESTVSNPPGKRGRKPGPLSRSAREAQRRLNHSIIEKARRTKINNALATLKELVPPDYGRKAKQQDLTSDEEDDSDNDDGDGDYGDGKKKSKAKPTRRKEEREREYKLEVLVRTVAYMQDLLQRVAKLEQDSAVCHKCGSLTTEENPTQPEPSTEALATLCTTSPSTDPSDAEDRGRTKRARLVPSRHPEPAEFTAASPLGGAFGDSTSTHRLPSISSWLPETLLDPSGLTCSPSCINHQRNKEFIPPLQLLTPPSFPHFDPVTPTSGLAASLTPSVSRPSRNMQQQKPISPMLIRTAEDEHAATMLLQISSRGSSSNSSPIFRPLPPSVIPTTECLSSMSSKLPSAFTSKGDLNLALNPRDLSIQTPASFLGLMTPIL